MQAPGKLATNIMHFARLLRASGLAVGPDRVLDALTAVEAAGLQHRDDFYWSLHAVFVSKHGEHVLFDQAFHIFWRDPDLLKRAMALMLPSISAPVPPQEEKTTRRLAEAMLPHAGDQPQAGEPEIEFDAALSFSDQELLRKKDFEQMSLAELNEAQQAIRKLRLPIQNIRTRRFAQGSYGDRVDMRATLRQSLRQGGAMRLRYKRPVHHHPPLVLLCDISGSMSRYSRMLLHFMHAITNEQDRVYSFVFGTRLTNISHMLRERDVDEAMQRITEIVADWDGGTRIGHCLREFNMRWSRRVLTQGPVVILISDGLDRDAAEGIGPQIERLHKSCRRLIWLNPLLRYEAFAPKSMGVRAILPHVDEFRTAHNLDSLVALADALNRPQTGFGIEKFRSELRAG
ncbi:MAG: VWA domain-containing protein [Alphaproteobacteria bacterium]|nr:VWA domain-containing protein [Alphaproteobacteria bacterium]